ncbi:early nodulin-like protein 1 [Mangifera indica]|uniref:early nodulin-like protein 1 n=1 Tax=Mangifera indica TaxID=29780 RepID=UPI001CFBB6E5|nr:early nodulin-like protein 1 [Mangifera indica]
MEVVKIWLALTCLLLVYSEAVPFCDKKELVVGGNETSWTIPLSNNSFDEWANTIDEFVQGDTLIFRYDDKTDSVLEVSKGDYEACETSRPIKEYRDGNTTIELELSGRFYFISGAAGHCQKGQKLRVHVNPDSICYVRTRTMGLFEDMPIVLPFG